MLTSSLLRLLLHKGGRSISNGDGGGAACFNMVVSPLNALTLLGQSPGLSARTLLAVWEMSSDLLIPARALLQAFGHQCCIYRRTGGNACQPGVKIDKCRQIKLQRLRPAHYRKQVGIGDAKVAAEQKVFVF
jgi:hypothetical protein